jgi:hypothetical protein
VRDPSNLPFEVQCTLYGGVVSMLMMMPSTVKVTDLTPPASDAVAVMFTFLPTCSPGAGDVMLTDGAVVSMTTTMGSLAIDALPAASTATVV